MYGCIGCAGAGACTALASPSILRVNSEIWACMLFAICAFVAESVLNVAALWLLVSLKCWRLLRYACSASWCSL